MIDIKAGEKTFKGIEAIVFDKDGTLIDSDIYWGEIIRRRAVAIHVRYGCQGKKPKEEINKTCTSMGLNTALGVLFNEGPVGKYSRDAVISSVILSLCKRGYEARYIELYAIFKNVHSSITNADFGKIMKPLKGVRPFLNGLKSAIDPEKFKLAIVSMDDTKNVQFCETMLNLNKYNYCTQGVGGSSATKFDISRQFLLTHSINPEKCLFIGDTVGDAQIAKALGGISLGICSGQTLFHDLLKACDEVVMDMSYVKVQKCK